MNPQLLGMSKVMSEVMSEDSLRRNLTEIDETAGLSWLQTHLDYCTTPLLSLWTLLDHLGRHRWPSLLRGDTSWGVQPVMAAPTAD